jgi:quercetin dioxygenase-like cupin family protein
MVSEISVSAPINSREAVALLEQAMLGLDQVECPVNEIFAPGVYYREIFMPAGLVVVGHEHKTKHLNIVLSGRALVTIDGQTQEIGPGTFVSEAGVRKALVILEDMRWATIHPTDETDPKKLEESLITKSEQYLEHTSRKEVTS